MMSSVRSLRHVHGVSSRVLRSSEEPKLEMQVSVVRYPYSDQTDPIDWDFPVTPGGLVEHVGCPDTRLICCRFLDY